MKPGIYVARELSNEAYHADTSAISKSGLDLIHRSPAHYYAAKLDPDRPAEKKDTPALRFGRAFHTLVLEPDLFFQEYAVLPEKVDRRTKAGKEAWAEFEAELGGREALTAEDGQRLGAMAAAVRAHPAAKLLLSDGVAEQSAVWDDFMTGARCKCRMDWWRGRRGRGPQRIAVDLKTTLNASRFAFRKSVVDYRYHVQAAFYSDGWKAVTDDEVRAFLLIAVEKDPPYGVAVYQLDEELVEAGRRAYMADLALYASCVERGEWPAYSSEVEVLDAPAWMTMTTKDEEEKNNA